VKAIAWSPHQNNLLASGGGIYRVNLKELLIDALGSGTQALYNRYIM
jgi:hypothetical protein